MGFFDKFEAKELKIVTVNKPALKKDARTAMVDGLMDQITYAEKAKDFASIDATLKQVMADSVIDKDLGKRKKEIKRNPFWFKKAGDKYGTIIKFGIQSINPFKGFDAGKYVIVGDNLDQLIEFYKDCIKAVEVGELDHIIDPIVKERQGRGRPANSTATVAGQGELEATPVELTREMDDDQPVIEVQDEIIPHQTVSSRHSNKK
ncbi:hypothetical protein [Gluconobacter albidus]|nr:hypothetical protein [Gluconobacter albidus]KXV42468.1 hypothetical protein AD941_00725 [Gluconobacter albidus]